VRSDVDSNETATFLIAAYEGYVSLATNSQDVRVLQSRQRNLYSSPGIAARAP
jgi:hypothetical protein